MSLERDYAYVTSMAEEFKNYMLTDQLYYSPSGISIQATVGGTLMRIKRLAAREEELTNEQQTLFRQARSTIEAQIGHWRVQADDKVRREVETRITDWSIFIEELEDAPGAHITAFPVHAESRTVLTVLARWMKGCISEEQGLLISGLDARYRLAAEPAEFLWDDAVTEAFPEEDYWWLYTRPVEEPELEE